MQNTIIAIYMLGMIAVGLALRSRIRRTSDLLVAGGKLGIVLTTATFAAIQLGAGVIMGGSELATQAGAWAGMWAGLGCGGGLILAGFVSATKMRRRGSFVPLDYFAERYGEIRAVRIWAFVANVPSLLGALVIQLMAAGTISELFGLSYAQGVWASAFVVMVYSMLGGMWGAVVTDLIQLAIIVVGIPALALTTLDRVADQGIELGSLLAVDFIPEGMTSKAVFNILPFLLMISVSYDACMRFQSAKSAATAKWGAIVGGVIVILISFCVGIVGAAGEALAPELEDKAVLPHMIQSNLDPLWAGIVLAALLAASMSTANSLAVSISGSCVRDFYNKVLHPTADLDQLPLSKPLARVAIALAVLSGAIIALFTTDILYTMIIFATPYMASMFVPLLGGILWPGATRRAALAAMWVGGTIGLAALLVALGQHLLGLLTVDEYWIDWSLLLAYVCSATAFIAVGRHRPTPRPNSAGPD